MIGNIQYAEQLNKGFPALESKPGFSSASSCVDECSPSRLPGVSGVPGSLGPAACPDPLWSPDTVPVIERVTSSIQDEQNSLEYDKGDLDPHGLIKPYLQVTGTGEPYRSAVPCC